MPTDADKSADTHQHAWGEAEVISGPSHVGDRFRVCVVCYSLIPISEDPLHMIVELKIAEETAHQEFHKAVHNARDLRYTWHQIGQVLGISRQAAWERFSRRS